MHGIALSDARVGTAGVVASVDLPDEVSHHLAHLGYRIDGVEVGLRNETAQHIFLQVAGEASEAKDNGEAEAELTGAAR